MTAPWWTCDVCGVSQPWEEGDPCPSCGAPWGAGPEVSAAPAPESPYKETSEDVDEWLLYFFVRRVARHAQEHGKGAGDMEKARRYLGKLIDKGE